MCLVAELDLAGFFGRGEIQHFLDRQACPGADGFLDMDFVAAVLQYVGQVAQAVHRHPRTVCTRSARGAFTRGRGFDQQLAGGGFVHLVEDAVVGGNDEFGVGQGAHGVDQLRGRADDVGQRDHRLRRLGVYQHSRLRVFGVQLFQRVGLEGFVHHARALPQQHVGAADALHVIAQVAIRRPQQPVALAMQIFDDLGGDTRGDDPVGARFHRRAGVGVDDREPVRVGVAERGKFVCRAGQVERTLGAEVGHDDALFRIQDLGGLAHELDPGDDQRLRRVGMAEACHLQRIRYAATGFLGQVLQVGGGVVMRDQHRVLLLHQCLDARLERLALIGVEHFFHHGRRLDDGFDGNGEGKAHRNNSGARRKPQV